MSTFDFNKFVDLLVSTTRSNRIIWKKLIPQLLVVTVPGSKIDYNNSYYTKHNGGTIYILSFTKEETGDDGKKYAREHIEIWVTPESGSITPYSCTSQQAKLTELRLLAYNQNPSADDFLTNFMNDFS